MRHQITIAHRTDTGREREENQDSIVYIRDERNDCHLLVVADGLGGGSCGQLASQIAAQTIRQSFFMTAGSNWPINNRLELAISEANRLILHRAGRNRKCKGMGSTCAVLVLADEFAYLGHLGDSRIYHMRENRITQLTRDHSITQRMLDDGLITPDEAAVHPERDRLDRALGMRADIKSDIRQTPIPLCENDFFILCTDGLTSLLRDEEIYRIVSEAPADLACEALVDVANHRGGHDNITIAVVRIGGDVTLTF